MVIKRIERDVVRVYQWIDMVLQDRITPLEVCDCCGSCCDFDKYGHRLFVTTPEMIYFLSKIKAEQRKQMANGVCPYLVFGECSIHKYRFAGCRIFLCRADEEVQSHLSEFSLRKFKNMCNLYSLPYRYQDLSSALADIADPDSWLHRLIENR